MNSDCDESDGTSKDSQNNEMIALQSSKMKLESHQQEGERPDTENDEGDSSKLMNFSYTDEESSYESNLSRSNNTDVCCNCEKGIQILQYSGSNQKKVYVGECMGHSDIGCITYSAMKDDGRRVVAKKWCLPAAKIVHNRNRQLDQLQRDFNAIQNIENPYLVPYFAMELGAASKETGEQIVYIFRDYVEGVSLRCLQEQYKVLDKAEALRLLRAVALGVFGALHELHHAGALHRDVRAEHVFLARGGARLAGAALDARLAELLAGDCFCHRQTKAQDISEAAQMLLSIVSEDTSQGIPPDLPSSAKDFFSRCLIEDESCQWSAEKLMNHEFLNDNDVDGSDLEDVGHDEPKRTLDHSISINSVSRLNNEFTVLSVVGRGSFGEVLKVQHDLVGGIYAIKCVKLTSKNVELNERITAEAKMLSKLTHENVVRYYSSWKEPSSGAEWYGSEPLSSDEETSESVMTEGMSESSGPLKQVLYIQMEFCEKNTLRQAIDNGLHQEHLRAWRLFREILEGLVHIHQKDMIHRDLKPMNIFLDSNDNVKIGDFGLAKLLPGLAVDDETRSHEEAGALHTAQVGTALYTAPELKKSSAMVKYNQKADIYSLGVILFEMFHAPFATGAERYDVLTKLRKKAVKFPKDFKAIGKLKQVLRQLLSHDVDSRPTSAELVSSQDIPRMVSAEELSYHLSYVLPKRRSQAYQLLVERCMSQQPSPEEDSRFQRLLLRKPTVTIAAIQDCIIKVFRSHGATEFSPPTLTPRLKRWDAVDATKVMTSSGLVCHLPYDLRLPFARYIAHLEITNMRRYVVGRVYSESKRGLTASHPQERVRCSFDIVTPQTDRWADAELVRAAERAAAACGLRVALQLNHAELLRSLLLASGVPPDKHRALHPVLLDVSTGEKSKSHLRSHLTTLGIERNDQTRLLGLMKKAGDITFLRSQVIERCCTKLLAFDKALNEVQQVIEYSRKLGCDCEMTVAPFLVDNMTQHSGVFWLMSVVGERQLPAKDRSQNIIAAGGRYDDLVREFRKVPRVKKYQREEPARSSVGFFMYLDRMARILTFSKIENTITLPLPKFVVCMPAAASEVADHPASEWFTQVVKWLWQKGCGCITWPHIQSDRIVVTCMEQEGSFLVIREDTTVRICTWKEGRYLEHVTSHDDLTKFMEQNFFEDKKNVKCSDEVNSGSIAMYVPRYVPRRAYRGRSGYVGRGLAPHRAPHRRRAPRPARCAPHKYNFNDRVQKILQEFLVNKIDKSDTEHGSQQKP